MHWLLIFATCSFYIFFYSVVEPTSASCVARKKNSFHFVTYGHARSKKKCLEHCCRQNCHLSFFSPESKTCHGLTCSRKELCQLIENQLTSFAGHRVDKRSLDSDDTVIDPDEDVTSKGENDNTESQADIKQTIKREVDETEYHPWRRQHNKMCPASKSHHTIIPEREKGFRFHKFHGHTHSLKECNIRCCDRKECVLSFQIASTCYGVICDEAARSCHSTNDQLDQIKIYFTSLKDAFNKKPHNVYEVKNFPSEEEELKNVKFKEDEEDDLMFNLKKNVAEESEVRRSHHKHRHHPHHPKIEEDDGDTIPFGNIPVRKLHVHVFEKEPILKEMKGEDNNDDSMILPDSKKHHDYSGMDMHDDLEMLKARQKSSDDDKKESVGETFYKKNKHEKEKQEKINDVESSGSGEVETKKSHDKTQSQTKKNDRLEQKTTGKMSTKFVEYSQSGSGSGSSKEDVGETHSKQDMAKDQQLKRDKITKPEKNESKKYGHKEDIFHEFKKTKHKEEVLKEVSRLKKLENEIKKQENFIEKENESESSSGGDETEGSGIKTKQHKKKRKKKNKKYKTKKINTTTTTTTTATTTTPTQQPTSTKTLTTTTSKPVVAVLNYKSHTLHPTKSMSQQKNKTLKATPPPHNAKMKTTISFPIPFATPLPKTTKLQKKTKYKTNITHSTTTTTTAPATKHTTTTSTTSTPATTAATTTTVTPATTASTSTTTTTTTAKTTTPITTVIRTRPTFTTYKVPAVRVDGQSTKGESREGKSHPILNYDEEESIKDLSRAKKLKSKKIPSLNIDVGDADVERDEQPQQQSYQQQQTTPNRKQNDFKHVKGKEADFTTLKNKTLHKESSSITKNTKTTPIKTTTTTTTPTTTTTTTKLTTKTTVTTTPTTTLSSENKQDIIPPYDYQGYPPKNEGEYNNNYNDYQEPNGWKFDGDRYRLPPLPPLYSRYHDNEGEEAYDGSWQQHADELPSNDPEIIEQLKVQNAPLNNLDPSFNPYNLGYNDLSPVSNGQMKDVSGKHLQVSDQPKESSNNYLHVQSTKKEQANSTVPLTTTPPKEVNNRKENTTADQLAHNKSKISSASTTTNTTQKNFSHDKQHSHQQQIKLLKNETKSEDGRNDVVSNKTHHGESPQQTVERILGEAVHISNQSNRGKHPKEINQPIDTIHKILGDSLDKFFTENEKKYKNREKNISLNKTTQTRDNLNEFFKKAEISPKEEKANTTKKLNSQAIKKAYVETHDVVKLHNKTNTNNNNIDSSNKNRSNINNKSHLIKQHQPPVKQETSELLTHTKDCPLKKDLAQYTFKDINNVGYKFKMNRKMTVDDCFQNCCQHDTCHVAYFEEKECYLVQCKQNNLCEEVVPTNKKSRLIFLNKTTVGTEKFCPQQNSGGIIWEKTPARLTSEQPCPRDAVGKNINCCHGDIRGGEAKRLCNEHSKWLPSNFSGCVSKGYASIKDKTKGLGHTESASSLTIELEEITSETIDNSLIFGGDLKMVAQILSTISQFLNSHQKENFDEKELKAATKTISNLLDEANSNEWENIKESASYNLLVKSLETFGINAAKKKTSTGMMKTITTRTILSSVGKMDSSTIHSNKVHSGFTLPDYTQTIGNEWLREKDSITLPKNIFHKGSPTIISSAIYKTLGPILPHKWKAKKFVTFEDGFTVNSNILSCAIEPKPQVLSPPLTIVLHHLKEPRYDKSECVWWDLRESKSSWSSEGCKVVESNRSMTICQCNHLSTFAILSNINEQRISAKEELKEHRLAIMWLGIPLMIVVLVGALYTCFTWSNTPKKRQVVILDKKPVLPRDDVFVTQEISQRFHGSPKKKLYAANHNNTTVNCTTSSPSDLEWEHAWDCLTNSGFDTNNTKRLQQQFKKQFLRNKLLRQQRYFRRKNLSESSSSTENLSDSSTANLHVKKYFRCNNDHHNWSKEKTNYITSKTDRMIGSQKGCCLKKNFRKGNLDEQIKDHTNQVNSFSPVAISSPHSQSFEEFIDQSDPLLSDHYLQTPLDVLDTFTESTLDSVNQLFSDIESTIDDLLENKNGPTIRIQPLHHQTMTDVRILIESDLTTKYQPLVIPFIYKFDSVNSSKDTGYQSSNNETFTSETDTDSKVNVIKRTQKLLCDHIFTRESFQGFQCNEFCCMTYIDKLFVEKSGTEKNCFTVDTSDDEKNFRRTPLKGTRLKRKSSSTGPLRKLMLQNTAVSASGYRIKMNSYTKECSKTSPTQSGNRIQTPHMRGYIALRQQCRLNEDLSPLTRSKALIPNLNSPMEIGGIRKSKLKRKKAFKVHSESDNIGKARQRIFKRSKTVERQSLLSTSSSFESLTNLNGNVIYSS